MFGLLDKRSSTVVNKMHTYKEADSSATKHTGHKLNQLQVLIFPMHVKPSMEMFLNVPFKYFLKIITCALKTAFIK
jgi:hypothetical protein